MLETKTTHLANSHEQFLLSFCINSTQFIQFHDFFSEKIVLQLVRLHRILKAHTEACKNRKIVETKDLTDSLSDLHS